MYKANALQGLGDGGDHHARELARHALRLRQRRNEHFRTTLFKEPAWDVMLHLFVHEYAEGGLSAAALAAAVGTSEPTIRRWLDVLIGEQLVVSVPAQSSSVPAFAISGRGLRSMIELLSE